MKRQYDKKIGDWAKVAAKGSTISTLVDSDNTDTQNADLPLRGAFWGALRPVTCVIYLIVLWGHFEGLCRVVTVSSNQVSLRSKPQP